MVYTNEINSVVAAVPSLRRDHPASKKQLAGARFCGNEVWVFGSGVIGRVENLPFQFLPPLSVCKVREQKQVPCGNVRKKNKNRILAKKQSSAGAGKIQGSLRYGAKSAGRTPSNKERSPGPPHSGRDDSVGVGPDER